MKDVLIPIVVIVAAALILFWIGILMGVIDTGDDPAPEPSSRVTIPGDLELLQIPRGDGIGLPGSADPGERSSAIGADPVI